MCDCERESDRDRSNTSGSAVSSVPETTPDACARYFSDHGGGVQQSGRVTLWCFRNIVVREIWTVGERFQHSGSYRPRMVLISNFRTGSDRYLIFATTNPIGTCTWNKRRISSDRERVRSESETCFSLRFELFLTVQDACRLGSLHTSSRYPL